MLLGRATKATRPTRIEAAGSVALHAHTTDDAGTAIVAVSPSFQAVPWDSTSGIGLVGGSLLGRRVLAESSEDSRIHAFNASGRAAVFAVGYGRKAQLRLVPLSASTHPANGAKGDLFVHKRADHGSAAAANGGRSLPELPSGAQHGAAITVPGHVPTRRSPARPQLHSSRAAPAATARRRP